MVLPWVLSLSPPADNARKKITYKSNCHALNDQLADTPALQEMGVKDFASTTPIVLMAPAGTLPDIVKKLNDAVAGALANPAVRRS